MSARPPVPYVVGVPRSGTTLLRMMLDAHSTLAIPQETDFGPALQAFERGGVEAALEAIVGGELWGDYGLRAEDLARRVEAGGAATFADVARAFYELYAERRGKPRWGNKTPYNLLGMTLIQRHFPEARFVHIVRDGRDVALSMAPVWFGPGDVAGVARHWSRMLASARREAAQVPFYAEVRYEELVRQPAATLSCLCEFLELEWEPAMLDYHRVAGRRLAEELRDVRAAGRLVSREERLAIHRRVASPPQPDRVECWRTEMSRADREAFEAVAAPTLRAFGYELDRS